MRHFDTVKFVRAVEESGSVFISPDGFRFLDQMSRRHVGFEGQVVAGNLEERCQCVAVPVPSPNTVGLFSWEYD